MNIPKSNCVCNTGVRSAPGDGNVFSGFHTIQSIPCYMVIVPLIA